MVTDGPACAASRTPLRILILGGTAFIGIHMTELALARGHRVTLFNRGKAQPVRFPSVEKLKGDRDGQLDALQGREWDAVIDNSGYLPRHVRMSAELLAPKVRQYLFVSTISVYADFTRANDESSPVATVTDEAREDWKNVYGPLKALCEGAVERAFPGRATVIRPGLIVGPEDPTDRFTYWPARAIRGGEMLAPAPRDTSFQLIDARDLAKFCLDAVERNLTGVFNVTSPAGMFTMGDIVNASADVARAEVARADVARADVAPVEVAPARAGRPGAARFAGGFAPPLEPIWVPGQFLQKSGLRPFVDLPGWLPEEGEMLRLHYTRVERAIAAGLKISPLRATAGDTLAWHLGRPEAEQAKLRAGIAAEREREILALWRAERAGC